MNRVQQTVELMRNGGLNCAQSILTAFGESCGVSPEEAKTLGRPWGGGVAGLAGTCGFLTGGVLLLAKAFDGPDEKAARQATRQAVRTFLAGFEQKRGSTLCRDLLGADMNTPEGAEKIAAEKREAKTCHCDGGLGADAAALLEQILAGS